MSEERELLKRALDALEDSKEEIAEWGAYASAYFREKHDHEGSITRYDALLKELASFLAAEPEAEPFGYVSHHKVEGPFKWQFTKELAEVYPDTALSITPLYLHPPRLEPARKLLPEKIDPILRTVGSMRYSPSYVAGWNNCIDAINGIVRDHNA